MKKWLKVMGYISIVLVSIFTLTGCFSKQVEKATNSLKARNDKAISLGKWNDNTYTNDFLNIKYTMPEGWTKHTDEEIASMMDIGTEYLNDDQKIAAKLAELTSVTYLMTSEENTGSSVILMSERQISNKVKMETYISALKTQLSNNESIDYDVSDMTEEIINGVKYSVLKANASMSGVNVYQKYYVRKQDKYFVAIVVTSTISEDELNKIVSNFEKIN